MRRRGNSDDGFILCFMFNLLFNYWWGILTLVLWVLFLIFRIPLYWTLIGALVWFGVAFLSTCLVTWAVKNSNEPTPHRENLNPYSAKNSDVFGAVKTQDVTTEAPSDIGPESGPEPE